MLKSRSREVRDVARNTLVKMVVSLGPSFLSFVISELKHLLNKGFQVFTHKFCKPQIIVVIFSVNRCM